MTAKIQLFQVNANEIAAYDIASGVIGMPDANDVILRFNCIRSFSLPENLQGSIAKAGTSSTETAIFSIQKNGSQFATLTFETSGNGVFNGVATLFEPNDVLTIVAPATQDASLADIYFTIRGTLV